MASQESCGFLQIDDHTPKRKTSKTKKGKKYCTQEPVFQWLLLHEGESKPEKIYQLEGIRKLQVNGVPGARYTDFP